MKVKSFVHYVPEEGGNFCIDAQSAGVRTFFDTHHANYCECEYMRLQSDISGFRTPLIPTLRRRVVGLLQLR